MLYFFYALYKSTQSPSTIVEGRRLCSPHTTFCSTTFAFLFKTKTKAKIKAVELSGESPFMTFIPVIPGGAGDFHLLAV